MLKRFKTDFYLAMLTLVTTLIVLCILPYAVYRLYTGNYLVGFADLVVVLSSLIATTVAWRSGDTVKPGVFMAAVFCIGVLVICFALGIDGLFWVYPFMVFIFFLVSPFRAFILLLLLLISLFVMANVFPNRVFSSQFQMMAFFVTTGVTSIFAFIFAYRAQVQRFELHRLATTDGLTGAANRRTLNDRLAIAVLEMSKLERPYGLLLLDLDHFKQINDNHGHKQGDEILVKLVPVLQSLLRQSDQVFRFGGEEFVVLISDVKPAMLLVLAEKLRAGVQQQMVLPNGSYMTTSIGGAMLKPDEEWESWLHRADMALYQAKHQGRNQVVIV
ncbi:MULTISPECIES: GGDEF domain-containing protein [Rheinheimera]|uniref:GGDEF domain-containing protein n=1 Tax=Rheinheimera TaxID=67575 RepID=UPI00105136A0|nr:GGDEF domain-containing protein [Rheinheimera sp. D18]QBL08868.1 GGDEF domain-containing protein [Rheinheimera sp. D18]